LDKDLKLETGNVDSVALALSDVAAGYGDKPIVHEVSFSVTAGSLLGIIGPNGAGKTTLLRVLSGALPLSAGSLLIHGEDVRSFRRRELAQVVGFVPQTLDVPVAFTVSEFVAMGRTPYVSGWSRLSHEDDAAIHRAMEMTDIQGLESRLVDELSAGEKQRAVVAMALAQDPQVLLLDEPTAHLDIQHAWNLMALIVKLNKERGVTVVLSSHDLNLAAEFCSHLLLMKEGRTVAHGTPQDVLEADRLSRVYEHPLEIVNMQGDRRYVVPKRL
jgi:iron complex transport system ATP-binding protein